MLSRVDLLLIVQFFTFIFYIFFFAKYKVKQFQSRKPLEHTLQHFQYFRFNEKLQYVDMIDTLTSI